MGGNPKRLIGCLIAVVLALDVATVASRSRDSDRTEVQMTEGDAPTTPRPGRAASSSTTSTSSTTSITTSPTTTTPPTTAAPHRPSGPAPSAPPPPMKSTTGPSVVTYGPIPVGPEPKRSPTPTRELACPIIERAAVNSIDRPGIYLAHEPGGGLVRFTRSIGTGTFSPDGSKLAFDGNPSGVCVADVSTGQATRIVDQYLDWPFTGHRGLVEWSPDGTMFVARVSLSGGPKTMIFPINGEAPIALESPGANQAAWSPNGTELCVTAGFSIECFDRRGTFLRRVTLDEHAGDWLQWLSNGRLAVYLLGDVLLVDPDGSNPQRVRLGVIEFDWLASGYAALNRENSLWVRTPDGRVSDLGQYALAPRWAANGRIVYMENSGGGSIRSINPDGTGRRTLVAAPGGATSLTIMAGVPALTGTHVAVTVSYTSSLP